MPLVFTAQGRMEVPVGALLSIRESVDDVRSTGERRLHVLEPLVLENRRLAKKLSKGFQLDGDRQSGLHRNVELLSLAYHQALAKTMRRGHVEDARQVLRRWVKQGRIDPRYATEWASLLDTTMPEIRSAISEDSQKMRDLRQSSPFAGMLSEPERREVIRLFQ